jgi:hypothetical protein
MALIGSHSACKIVDRDCRTIYHDREDSGLRNWRPAVPGIGALCNVRLLGEKVDVRVKDSVFIPDSFGSHDHLMIGLSSRSREPSSGVGTSLSSRSRFVSRSSHLISSE